MTKIADCEKFGHDYSRSKNVSADAFGVKKRRVYYCSFCGVERPRRKRAAIETGGVIPMPSTQIADGEYEVIGTSRSCVVKKQGSLPSMTRWYLFVDGEHERTFRTKRAALVYCQEHSEL